MPADSLAAAVPTVPMDPYGLVIQLAPMLTPAGIVVLLLAWYFREDIKLAMRSRGAERRQILTDVQAIAHALEAHITEEKNFWEKQERRVEKVEEEARALELQLAALTATASAQHEAVLGKLADLAEAVRDLRRP